MSKYLVIALLFVIPLASATDIYKCIDNRDIVIFSEKPCSPDAVKIRETPKTPVEPNKPAATEKGKAVFTLENGSRVEVVTKTLYLFVGMETSQTNTLNLPNGMRIPFTEIKSINIKKTADKAVLNIKVLRSDGGVVLDRLTEPWMNIAGDNASGRFSKPVTEIKSIEFAE